MTEAVNSNLKKQLDEFKTELELSNSVKNDLKKQLESKEKVLQINNEKKKQLQTTIDGLTKIVDLLNQTVKDLCEHPEDVSTCKVEAITVRSLRNLAVSGTSTLGRRQSFCGLFYPFHLGQGQWIISRH